MFNSLRSRLWFTYALVIAGILVIVGIILLTLLITLPVRQAYQRLSGIASVIENRDDLLGTLSVQRLQTALEKADKNSDARIVILSSTGQTIADSRLGKAAPLPTLPQPPLGNSPQAKIQFRDSQGKYWVYAERSLVNGDILVVAVTRPKINLRQLLIIRDDFLVPVLEAGILSLLLALLLAFWIARWVEKPLENIAAASRDLSAGHYHSIKPEGPREVQDLALAFNEMTDQVKNSQKSQKELIANVSHDLKTPLTSIQGFAQAILDGTAATPEELRKAADVIYSEAGRMYRMVLDLLELARLESGIADLKRTPVDLNPLLTGVVDKLLPQARQAHVQLEAEIPSLPILIGDGDRLSQVFSNLIENAIKYSTPESGKVFVAASHTNGQVEVTVTDNGSGISPENLPHIFERFYRGDKSRQDSSGQGAGLGLAIAQEIVSAHHGSISAQSVLGQGSAFVVKLPLTQKMNQTG